MERYLDAYIDWAQIEEQLVYKNTDKGTIHAHTGEITVRVASSDGCVEETVLLAVQMLLWTCRLRKLENVLQGK